MDSPHPPNNSSGSGESLEPMPFKTDRLRTRRTRSMAAIATIAALGTALLASPRAWGQLDSAQALMEQAGKALDAGDAAKAIALYEQLLRQSPGSVDARINLGVALAQQGRYDEAARQDREALARSPRNPDALLNLALAYYKMGDYAKAHDEFAALNKLHPDNQQAFLLLADCDERLGLFKEAITLLEPAYQASPENPTVEYLLGNALIRDEQTERGAAVIDRIMRNGDPDVANVLLGATRYAARDYNGAAETLGKALEHNPQLPGAWTLYGRALLNSGENEKAKTALEKAVQADPNDFDACLHFGALLRHDGELERAAPLLQHALRLRPDSATALFQVSALEAGQGQLEEARTAFEKIVARWPDFVEAHVQLATIYARLHRTVESERERKIVANLNENARTKGPQTEPIP